jgi:ubiquinone biosynthesis protein
MLLLPFALEPVRMDLSQVTEHLDLTAIVPDAYAAYRQAVGDALAYFLENLSAARLDSILVQQMALPQDASPAERVVGVMRECPTLHKLGQVLAHDARLEPAFRERLRELEMFPSNLHPVLVEETIRAELGHQVERYRIELEISGTLEASVAFVVPCRYVDPDSGRSGEAMLKVVKPNFAEHLEEELEILDGVATLLDERQERYRIPAFRYREVFATVRALLLGESDQAREQRHLREAAQRFARVPRVKVPALLAFSTPRLTAMEYIHGQPVTEAGAAGASASACRKLATDLVRSLMADAIFTREPDTIFHADPHAGNLFATADGRVAILDWSLAGHLEKSDRERLVDAFLGAVQLDLEQTATAIEQIAERVEDPQALRATVAEALGHIWHDELPDTSWFVRLFEDLVAVGVHFPPQMLLFRKSLFVLQGVLGEIDPQCSSARVMVGEALAWLLAEWPGRYLALPWSRAFASQLSNVDLMWLYCSAPIAVTRMLQRRGQNLWAGMAKSWRD